MSMSRTLQVSAYSTQEMAEQGDDTGEFTEAREAGLPRCVKPSDKHHCLGSSSLETGTSMAGARASPWASVVLWVCSGYMGQTPLLDQYNLLFLRRN